jgi:hypothetical protein
MWQILCQQDAQGAELRDHGSPRLAADGLDYWLDLRRHPGQAVARHQRLGLLGQW